METIRVPLFLTLRLHSLSLDLLCSISWEFYCFILGLAVSDMSRLFAAKLKVLSPTVLPY